MNQTVLITGASRGIGADIARMFAENGFHLVLTCKNSIKELETLSKELATQYHIKCHALYCDVSKYEEVEKLFESVKNQTEGIDILINNAGISHIGLLQDMTADEWNQLINTNLSSMFYCCKLAIPYMLQKKAGKIINISSIWGNAGASCEVAYSASKGGVNSFTKALAKELAPSNIQVNAISCGVIDTSMNQFLSSEERAALEDEIPAGRFGTPRDVAALAFSIINTTNYLTGQIITLDGGFL